MRGDEDEPIPVATTPGVADAGDFCVGSRVARLDAEIVTAGHDVSLAGIASRVYEN
jgi:hypothetical protein